MNNPNAFFGNMFFTGEFFSITNIVPVKPIYTIASDVSFVYNPATAKTPTIIREITFSGE